MPKNISRTSINHSLLILAVSSFPNVTRTEQKVRGMAIFFPTLNVRKTRMCHRGHCMAGLGFPDVTRRELKLRGRPFFVLTLHVGKTGIGHRGHCMACWCHRGAGIAPSWCSLARKCPAPLLEYLMSLLECLVPLPKCFVPKRLVNDVPCRAF